MMMFVIPLAILPKDLVDWIRGVISCFLMIAGAVTFTCILGAIFGFGG